MQSATGNSRRRLARAGSPLGPAAASSSTGGIVLGWWQLTQVVHHGQHATLYRARPAETSEGPGCYVVKAATVSRSDSIGRAMLVREAAVSTKVTHPNLTAVLASHLRGEPAHVVRPFVEGLTLREFVDLAREPAAIHWALWIVRQVAEGLAALHGAGWLHGQIRPEHIIVSPQGQATLIDLSLCRRLDSEECTAGNWLGAPLAYASPESLRTHARLTAGSDVYCLGLVLYELLTGQPPFAATNEARLAAMHREQAPADIRGQRSDAPPELAHVLRLMLAKEPLRRPGDDELVRWLTELEISALAW